MFIAALFTIAKTWNQPKCPSMIDWTGKMWHIYTMEYYAAIKNDEFVSFVGTWINLENIILSKLTQEQKMKYRIFWLIGGWRTMGTHVHREGSTTHTHWGLLGGNRGRTAGGAGEGQHGEKCQMWVKERKAAKHTAMCVPMQLSCVFCTCTPNLKCIKKKKKESCLWFHKTVKGDFLL